MLRPPSGCGCVSARLILPPCRRRDHSPEGSLIRQVYYYLILELYGRGKTLGSDLCADDGTRNEQPYPYAVTRSRYEWRGGRFVQEGVAEVFSDETNYASPVMTPYK
jgi:hypothetical protein